MNQTKSLCLRLSCLTLAAACATGGGRPVRLLTEPESKALVAARQSAAGLSTVRLRIGSAELTAEIARTPLQKASGLAFRTTLAPDAAMIFTNDMPQRVVYYTRDTMIPLSCAYIDANGIILEIHDMQPRDSRPIISKSDRVQFVLEVNRGWFERHGVSAGAQVQLAG